jgi:hypothetical protein
MVQGAANAPDAARSDTSHADGEGVQIASNAPGLRYTVMTEPASMTTLGGSDATERSSNASEAAPPIFIVVPD